MFYGNNQLKIDVKGRIAIPTRYREHLMNQYGALLVITPNVFELSGEGDKAIIQCLRMYPAKSWQLIASKAPSYGAKAAYEYMIEHAQEAEMDAQGRVLLHPVLRAEVHYEQHLQIVGKIDHFDLWREDYWEAHKKNSYKVRVR